MSIVVVAVISENAFGFDAIVFFEIAGDGVLTAIVVVVVVVAVVVEVVAVGMGDVDSAGDGTVVDGLLHITAAPVQERELEGVWADRVWLTMFPLFVLSLFFLVSETIFIW